MKILKELIMVQGSGIKSSDFKAKGLSQFKHITYIEQKNSLSLVIKKLPIKILEFQKKEKRLKLNLVNRKIFGRIKLKLFRCFAK